MRIKGMVGGLLGRCRSRRGRRSGFRHLEQPATSIVECLEVRNLLAAFVVDTVVDESDGDMSAGDLSLREAIETANAQAGADTITFSPAVFGSAQTIDLLLGQFAITDEVTITGPGRDLLTIDAQQNSRHFFVDDGDEDNEIAVAISDLTLINGFVTDGNDAVATIEEAGGAISSNEEIKLNRMTISGNETLSFGGGVYSSATATIEDSRIESNISQRQGGGVYNWGTLVLQEAVVVGNTSGTGGGGVHNFSTGHITILSSLMDSNRGSGGGGFGNSGTAEVRDSVVTNNLAGGGGGISNLGQMSVYGTIVSGNRASTGGGISFGFQEPEMVILNTTIADNTAESGGGISYSSAIRMTSSIVIGNVDDDGGTTDLETREFLFGGVITGSHNLIGDPATSGDLVHGTDGNIVGQTDGIGGREALSFSTVLSPLADNGGAILTHALVAGSPAIDAGDPNFDGTSSDPPITSDQRGDGFERVVDGNGDGTARIDIGAFESPLLPNLLLSESDDTTVVNEAGTDTIEVSLSRQPTEPVVVDVSIGTPTVISSDTAQHQWIRNSRSRVLIFCSRSPSQMFGFSFARLGVERSGAGSFGALYEFNGGFSSLLDRVFPHRAYRSRCSS